MVLPFSERILSYPHWHTKSSTTTEEYVGLHCRPQTCFEHFYIHTYRRIVLDTFPKNLALANWHMDPSSMTICHCENTSRCSLWYKQAYKEATADRAEDTLLQFALVSHWTSIEKWIYCCDENKCPVTIRT